MNLTTNAIAVESFQPHDIYTYVVYLKRGWRIYGIDWKYAHNEQFLSCIGTYIMRASAIYLAFSRPGTC